MAYNQSRIKMFRRCQKQYSFRYDYAEKLGEEGEMVPKVSKKPLAKGTWLHELLAAHHRQWAGVEGSTWKEVHEANTKAFEALFLEEREELGDLPDECNRLFRSYLRYWQGDADSFAVAQLIGGGPGIEFVVEVPLRKWRIQDPFKGQVDLIVEDREYGGLWIWDHKWVKNVPSPDERMMSPQSIMYVWALRKLGYDIRGFLNNYGRSKPPTIPPVLKKTGLLTMRKSLDTDRATYAGCIKSLHGDRWREYIQHVYGPKLKELRGREALWFRRERFPVDTNLIKQGLTEFIVSCLDIQRRNLKHPPRSYFYNCKFGCEYHDVCCAEFQGLDITPLIRKKFEFVGERYGDRQERDLLKD